MMEQVLQAIQSYSSTLSVMVLVVGIVFTPMGDEASSILLPAEIIQ